MYMSNFRSGSHVAQQSRRDKLRIQQCSTSVQHLQDFVHKMEQSSVNPDLIQVRNVRSANSLYDPSLVSSGIINFATSSDGLSGERDAMLHHELVAAQPPNSSSIMATWDDLFHSLPLTISSEFNASSRASTGDDGDFQGGSSSNCKSLVSQTNSDWMMNYASRPAGKEINQNEMQPIGEVLSNNVKMSDVPASRKYLKPNSFNEYQNVHSTVTNPSSEICCQDREKQQYGDMHCATPLFQNSAQGVVTLASIGTHEGLAVTSLVQHTARETGHASWTDSDSGNELVFLPNFGNQSCTFRYTNANTWSNRPVESCLPWNSESGIIAKSNIELNNVVSEASTQGLSLSLSSNLPSEMHVDHFGERYESQDLHSRMEVLKEPEEFKAAKFDYLTLITKPSSTSKGPGKSLPEGTSNFDVQRGTGPLGPFTGYATILKGSRFLRVAQELLDEFCNLSESKLAKTCDVSEKISGDQVSASISVDIDVVDVADKEIGAKGNSSGVSSSTFYSPNQMSGDGGVCSSSSESYRGEYQQKKARLVSLQEEVCKRYKVYRQQMTMVVSSFESVAGLSAATPYLFLALKSISKNFRCLKTAIANQLEHVAKALGEDSLSSNTSRLNYMDQSSQKLKPGGSNGGFLQQHVWRPQRGLPERSVAILRAWLFEHFLHPYPTDADKHMLATQTGLSRNQVSNWFINARVRVWKPMVEEIHMLETKGMAETSLNPKKRDGQSASDGSGRSDNGDEPMNKGGISALCDEQLDFSVGNEYGLSAEQWSQEKRSRVDCQVTKGMDRSLLSFTPYHRSGMEVGGVGAVSLTLGLRHAVESSHQHQQQQQEDQLRGQLGGQIIHDFVG